MRNVQNTSSSVQLCSFDHVLASSCTHRAAVFWGFSSQFCALLFRKLLELVKPGMFTNDSSCDVSKKASFVLPLFHKDVTGAVRVGCPTGASQEPRAAMRLAGPCPPVPGQSISTQQGSRDKTGMVIMASPEPCHHLARPQ